MKPDGTPFEIRLMVEGDNIPTLARAGTIIAQQWTMEGIDPRSTSPGRPTASASAPATSRRRSSGRSRPGAATPTSSFFLESYHSDFIKPPGEMQPPRNLQRWQSERLDAIIEANRTVAFDDPKVVELGMDYLKLAVEEMPFIPLMAYNKFAPFDTTYWTGFPSVDNPYSASGPFWSNLRYMIVELEPSATN